MQSIGIVGRKQEQMVIENSLSSGQPEFLAVYGRRRVGKTFLIREYFNNTFSFYSTGVPDTNTRQKLRIFHKSLLEYGSQEKAAPKDWFEAFQRLEVLLSSDSVRRDPASGRIVIFLDELPWMDSPKSDFKSALDLFWNSWASARKDVVLIVCGSATSWIIGNLIHSRGGFYNRITRKIHLMPFTLRECEELYQSKGFAYTRLQVVQSYMVFGGIPYYINCMDRRLSLAQNIDTLCFTENGQLYDEYDRLFSSLFRNADKHIKTIKALSKTKGGTTRSELTQIKGMGNGESLTKALAELEQCGFIRKYKNYVKNKTGYYYQVIDPFTLFHLTFLEERTVSSWMTFLNTPAYYAWCGNAFEIICFCHIPQIKKALGIQGVDSTEYAWRSKSSVPGAQIDLLIDRRDQVANICEVKFSESEFRITKQYGSELRNKLDAFASETSTKKALHLTMITVNGVVHNEYYDVVTNEITGDELFS